jgi:hypothetical protein
VDPTENSNVGDYTIEATHSTERILSQQPAEEIVDIEENGVVRAVEFAPKELKSTGLPDCIVCSLSVVSAFLTIP